ncbi:MAG: hypothetical protein M1817_000454 [Caeruleum heppii]|nr:MAG: hypothetical protein M1817_000454 [Caeruleum heppii]
MPSTKRKRISEPIFESHKSRTRQVRFKSPAPSIQKCKRTPLFSAARTRQQTLTQIDFVSRLPIDDLDVDHLEEEWQKINKKGEATKSITEPHQENHLTEKGKEEDHVNGEDHRHKVDSTAQTQDLGFVRRSSRHRRTPQQNRTLEIPSSQSPADSPSPTNRQRKTQSPRSPLKDRSCNTRPLSLKSPTKNYLRRVPKLEMQSSVSWENEGSQVDFSTQLDQEHITALPRPELHQKTDSTDGQQARGPYETVNQNAKGSNSPSPPTHAAKIPLSSHFEVQDSEDEETPTDDEIELPNDPPISESPSNPHPSSPRVSPRDPSPQPSALRPSSPTRQPTLPSSQLDPVSIQLHADILQFTQTPLPSSPIPHLPLPSSPIRPGVRFSQATTASPTQGSQPRFQDAISFDTEIRTSSADTPPTSPSLAPLKDGDGAVRMGEGEERREVEGSPMFLRPSQLLPASLMEGWELPMPPSSSIGIPREEEEEQEEEE